MKKLILSILFIAFVFASIGQNLKGYYVEAFTKLEAKRAFVIDLDTFYATTQLNGLDTILVSLNYVTQQLATKAPATGSTAYIQNQNASAQTASYWINGIGYFGDSKTIWSIDPVINVNRTLTGSGNSHAYSDASTFQKNAGTAYNSYDARATFSGTNNFDHYVAFQSAPTFNSSGTLTNNYGLYTVATANAGTITNNYGFFSANPIGLGTITNNFGIRIVNQTKGINNYGIFIDGATTYSLYVNSGKTFLAGNTKIADKLAIGTTDANTENLLIRGIGTQLFRLYQTGQNYFDITSPSGVSYFTFSDVNDIFQKFNTNSGVELNYNGSKKFETTNDGITVTGNATALTAKLTNLTDNYIPKHTSDATGLQNSNIFFSGNIARYGTANTFSNDRDIVDKAYVDAIASGNMPKLPVDAATTGNITLSGTQTIDGYSAGVGARILVWKQTTTSQNGVYIVASGAWTRATDLDTWAELYKAYVTVLNGAQSGSSFVCTVPSTGTLGTNPITWVLYNAPANILVNSPLSKTGNTISLNYDTNTLDVASGNLKVKDNVYQPLLNGTGFVKASGTTISYDNSTYLTTETDPIFAADSANLLHWSDTLNLTKGIASQYDLTTGLAAKQNTLTTGNLTENVTGLQFDATRQVIGGAAQLSLTSGYVIPTTTEQTNWNAAYTNRITSLTTTGSSGVATLISNVLNIPNYTLSGMGGVPTTRTLTINGTTQDLSANRTWNVGTVTSVGLSVPTGLTVTGSPITSSGTFAISFASGYSIPTTANQSNWNTAYGWGNHATAGYQTGTESYISNLVLSGNTLASTGVGSAFNSTVGNIANVTSANIFTQDQTIAKASGVSALKIKDSGSNIFGSLDADNGYFYVRNGKPYFINGDFGSTEIDLTPASVTYPSAGIAVSTGSAWGTSITNNSANWNTAYNDKINSLAVTGTTTKTITLTQQDGGTVTGNFTDNDTYTSLVSNGGLGVSGSSLYLSNINATGTAPLLTDYMWASPSSSTTVKSFTLQTLKDLIGTSSYTLPLAANGTRGGIQIGYTSTANNFALNLSSEKAYTALPDATTSVKGIASFNSSNFSVSSGAVSVATGGIGAMNLANSVISGQVDIGSDIVDTDEFLISDGGTLRRTDASRLKTYIGSNNTDLSFSGTGPVTLASSTGQDVTITGSGNISVSASSATNMNITYADGDPLIGNEYNTSMSWNDATNAIGVVDGGGTKSVTITGFVETSYPDLSIATVVSGSFGSSSVTLNGSVGTNYYYAGANLANCTLTINNINASGKSVTKGTLVLYHQSADSDSYTLTIYGNTDGSGNDLLSRTIAGSGQIDLTTAVTGYHVIKWEYINGVLFAKYDGFMK